MEGYDWFVGAADKKSRALLADHLLAGLGAKRKIAVKVDGRMRTRCVWQCASETQRAIERGGLLNGCFIIYRKDINESEFEVFLTIDRSNGSKARNERR